MKEERIPIRQFVDVEEDACISCSEKTVNCCGILHVKRWCLVLILLSLLTIGFMVPFIIYAVFFGEATTCRLTYTDNNNVTEADMQTFMARDDWPLTVPSYDPWRRTCVCKGYETKNPQNLQQTDEVLVWIAPGDLVSLVDEGKLKTQLDTDFKTKYRGHYAKEEHVKVCLPQELVLDLWNNGTDTLDGGYHCHEQSSKTPGNVDKFYLGWDGALFCDGGSSLDCSQCTRYQTTPGVYENSLGNCKLLYGLCLFQGTNLDYECSSCSTTSTSSS